MRSSFLTLMLLDVDNAVSHASCSLSALWMWHRSIPKGVRWQLSSISPILWTSLCKYLSLCLTVSSKFRTFEVIHLLVVLVKSPVIESSPNNRSLNKFSSLSSNLLTEPWTLGRLKNQKIQKFWKMKIENHESLAWICLYCLQSTALCAVYLEHIFNDSVEDNDCWPPLTTR